MEIKKYQLPYVPWGNRTSKRTRRETFEARMKLPEIYPRGEYNKRFHITVTLCYAGEQVVDIDNTLKTLFDVLKWRVIPDDRSIKKIEVEIVEYCGVAKMEVSIKEIPLNKSDFY